MHSPPTTLPYSNYDDEIDLLEIAIILWNNKWVIALFTVALLLCGMIYTANKSVVYEAKITFDINFYPASTHQHPEQSPVAATLALIRNQFGNGSFKKIRNDSLESYELTITSSTQELIQNVVQQLPLFNQKINQKILEQAKQEIATIENGNITSLKSTETAAAIFFNAKRLVHAIEDESANALFFHPVKEGIQTWSSGIIWIVSALLGAMVGIFIVLIRHSIKNRQTQKQNVS